MKRLLPFILISLLWSVTSCEQSTGPSFARNNTHIKKAEYGDGAYVDPATTPSSKASSEPTAATGTSPTPAIVYPEMYFRALGNVESIDMSNPVSVHMDQKLNDSEIKTTVTQFTTVDPSNLIKEHVEKLVGSTTYTRASSSQIQSLKENYLKGDFLYFATRARSQNQASHNDQSYTSPLPVAVLPKALAGYSAIHPDKTLNYTSWVNGTQVIEGKSTPRGFEVKSYVKFVDQWVHDKPANSVVIEIYNDILADSKGELYGAFLIPHKTRFYVDTVQRKIVRMFVEQKYHHSNQNALRKMTMPFFLCTLTINGKSETFHPQNCSG